MTANRKLTSRLAVMSSKNLFQTELFHIMGLYVETTVREMERLLDECAAVLENEENSLLKREMERVNTTNTVSPSLALLPPVVVLLLFLTSFVICHDIRKNYAV